MNLIRTIQVGKENKERVQYACGLGLCFVLPAMVLLLAFRAMDMAPFGDSSVLIMDMSDQYVEFFCGLKQVLRDGSLHSLFFSWGKAMGGNAVGVFAYYLSSPLSLLTLFVPDSAMPVGILFLTVLKVGLCGLTMGIFLQHMGFRRRFSCVFFAVCYALMSYTVIYSMCLMWLDGVIWLPIVLLGTEQLLRNRRMSLLMISLVAIFISNYYISYMVGVFAACWFVYRIASTYAGLLSVPDLLRRTGRFFLSAGTAAGLGAWLLLPTWYSLMQGKVGGNGVEASGVWNFSVGEFLGKMFLGHYDSITNSGSPFFYCGVVIFLLAAGYFVIGAIPIRERLASGCVLAFLLLSLASVRLDLAWHIFQYPNWFPYRYTFVVSFFLIYLASRCFLKLAFLRTPFCVGMMLLTVLGGFAMATSSAGSGPARRQIALTVALAMGYLLLFLTSRLLLQKQFPFRRGITLLLVLLLTAAGCWELYRNSLYLMQGLNRSFGYESYSAYREYRETVQKALAAAEANRTESGETAYAAVSTNFVRSINEPIGFGYRGISHYSSAYNRNSNQFFAGLGYAQSYFWSLHFGGTAVSESLLGVRYTMNNVTVASWAKKGRIQIGSTVPPVWYEELDRVKGAGTAVVYRNPYALTAPYVVPMEVLELSGQQKDYFTAQNELLNAMCAEDLDCLQPLDSGLITVQGSGITVQMPSDGILYAFFDGKGQSQRKMTVNGKYQVTLFRNESNCIQALGQYTAGQTATIQMNGAASVMQGNRTVFYVLDPAQLETAVTKLQKNSMQDLTVGTGYISGTVISNGGLLFTSIPYDVGWRVWIDGHEVEIAAFQEALLCIPISKGIHRVEMVYSARGAKAGFIISGMTALSVLGVWVISRMLRKEEKNHAEPAGK